MRSKLKCCFRYGIASLLLLTAISALVVRLTYTPGIIEVSFRDLRIDPASESSKGSPMYPSSIKRLHERRIHIKGYIYPTSVFREKSIRSFVLARDNNEPAGSLSDSDFVVVRMGKDSAIDFTTRPIAITGTFRVLDNPITSAKGQLLYEITDAWDSSRGQPTDS